jgi:hypothetical protein
MELHIEAGSRTDERVAAGAVLGFNRQCSIGYHMECSDPQGEECECPCHQQIAPAPANRLVEVSPGVWIRPELVVAVRDRTASASTHRCEIIIGQTAFLVQRSVDDVLAVFRRA